MINTAFETLGIEKERGERVVRPENGIGETKPTASHVKTATKKVAIQLKCKSTVAARQHGGRPNPQPIALLARQSQQTPQAPNNADPIAASTRGGRIPRIRHTTPGVLQRTGCGPCAACWSKADDPSQRWREQQNPPSRLSQPQLVPSHEKTPNVPAAAGNRH